MATMLYQDASAHFINREFADVAAGLTDLSRDVRFWVLYLALADRAFQEPDSKEWPYNDAGRKRLRARILKGDVWRDLAETWGDHSEVPPALLMSTIALTARHKADPKPASDFIEGYIASGNAPGDLLFAFVTNIVMRLQHDYFYARELANGSLLDKEPELRDKLISRIDVEEEAYLQQKKDEEEFVRREYERAAQELAEKEAAAKEAALAPEETIDRVSAPSKNGLQDSIGRGTVATTSAQQPSRPPRARMTLVAIWRQWFSEFIRSQAALNVLAAGFIIMGLMSSAELRRRARTAKNWLWAALQQGIKMGVKVTYL